MENSTIATQFIELTTPLIADACVRLQLAVRFAPVDIQPILPTMKVAGRALPAQHYGSVDIFLEALRSAQKGDVLVIDDQRRRNQACIGDLTVLEAQAHGVAGLVVWGHHRDTHELSAIGVPVFSYGRIPAGPLTVDNRPADALEFAYIGEHRVTRNDIVFADSDGVMFVEAEYVSQVLEIARTIHQTERQQVKNIQAGQTLYKQLKFDDYMQARDANPELTFRQHLRQIGGAIEE